MRVATRDNLVRLAVLAAAALLVMLTSFSWPVSAAPRQADTQRVMPAALAEVRAGQTDRRVRPILAPSSLFAAGPSAAATADIQVTYNSFSAAAQAAFEAAVTVWESQIVSSRVIHVTANWTPLGANVLGSAGPFLVPHEGRYHAAALAEAMCNCEKTPTEITANFNSGFAGWYLGTDGNPPSNKWDFYTVVLHEIGHGLGFIGPFSVSGSQGSWGWPSPYGDHEWSAATGGNRLTDTAVYANPSAQLKTELTDGSVFFGGPEVVAAYGGRAPLYSPSTWSGGSSNSHFDENTFATGTQHALMTPSLANGEVIHDPGPLTRALFRDIGWETADGTTDSQPPVVSVPTAALAAPQQLGTTASLTLTWPVATDASAIQSYQLQRRKGSGSWVSVSLATPTSTTAAVAVTPGSAYTFRLRATDEFGNTSAWVTTAAATLEFAQENDADVAYTGTWKRGSLSGASAGKVRYAGGAGRLATLTFTGTSVGFVTTRAAGRGIAEVWLDGALVATVDLYSATASKKSIAWASGQLASGTHSVEVRVTGTKNPLAKKTRVDVDAFLVWP